MSEFDILETYIYSKDLSRIISNGKPVDDFIKGAYLNNIVSNQGVDEGQLLNYFEAFYNNHGAEFNNVDKELLKRKYFGILKAFHTTSSFIKGIPLSNYSKFKALHSRNWANWLVDNFSSIIESYSNLLKDSGLIDKLVTYKYSSMDKNMRYIIKMYKNSVPSTLLKFNIDIVDMGENLAKTLLDISHRLKNFNEGGFLSKFKKKRIIRRIRRMFDISDEDIEEIFNNKEGFARMAEDYYRKFFK